MSLVHHVLGVGAIVVVGWGKWSPPIVLHAMFVGRLFASRLELLRRRLVEKDACCIASLVVVEIHYMGEDCLLPCHDVIATAIAIYRHKFYKSCECLSNLVDRRPKSQGEVTSRFTRRCSSTSYPYF
jgi:hypothetical protein